MVAAVDLREEVAGCFGVGAADYWVELGVAAAGIEEDAAGSALDVAVADTEEDAAGIEEAVGSWVQH